MAVVTCNGAAVIAGTIHFPVRGRWFGKIETTGTTATPVGTPVTLEIGGDPFVGTVKESLSDLGNRVTLTIVGGYDGLDDEVPPQHYYMATVGQILKDTLAFGSEVLALDSDSDVTALPLQHFSRLRGTVAETIKTVLATAQRVGGLSMERLCWRIDSGGFTWVGKQLWLPRDIDCVLVSEDPHRRSFTLGLERASAMPGATVLLHDLTDVTYVVDDRSLRAICTYGEAEQGHEAAQQSKVIRRETAHVDLYALYEFNVLGQNGDGTLELKSLDSRMPDMSHVSMAAGFPGVTEQKVTPGTTAYLTHRNGDSTKPLVVAVSTGPGMGLKVSHTAPIELTAPEVKAGGPAPLVLHDPMAGLWAALVSACAANTPPITVPPFVGCQTTITKGA